MICSNVKISNENDRIKNMINEKQKRIKIKSTADDLLESLIFDI